MARPAEKSAMAPRGRIALYILAGLVLFFLVAPVFIVVPISFSSSTLLEFPPQEFSLRWYRQYTGTAEWLEATRVSLVAALLTTIVATPLGVAAAYGLHASRFRLAHAVRFAMLTPQLVPVILVAIGVFYAYARLGIVDSMVGIVLAHTVLALPFVIVTVTSGLESYDMNQEMVARSLGASRLEAFMLVTLPQIRFSVITGALFAFITSLDEVVVGLFIAGGENSTLTRRMFNALRDQVEPTIAAISTLLIVICLGSVLAVQLAARRRR